MGSQPDNITRFCRRENSRFEAFSFISQICVNKAGGKRQRWQDDPSIRKIKRNISDELDPEQWKVEVRLAFYSTLARIQEELYRIVRCISPPGDWDNALNPETEIDKQLCRILKIPTPGNKNISVKGLIGYLSLTIGLWFLTIKTKKSIVLILLFRDLIPSLVGSIRPGCLVVVGYLMDPCWEKVRSVGYEIYRAGLAED